MRPHFAHAAASEERRTPLRTVLRLPDERPGEEPLWRCEAFAAPTDLAAFAARTRADLGICEFQQDAEWLAADRSGDESISVIADATPGAAFGLLAARVSKTDFEYTLRGWTVLRRKVLQYTIHQGPVIARNSAREAIEKSFDALASAMPRDAVAYVSAAPVDSQTHSLLQDSRSGVRKNFFVFPWGKECKQFKIDWTGSVERYLHSLAPKKRANVKRAAERLKTNASYHVRRFQAPAEVDEFLAVQSGLAATAQPNRDSRWQPALSAARRSLIRFAADRGTFIGYVLYIGETPAAYRYGFIYGQTLFAIATGYDHARAEDKPGAVVFFEMLRDLEQRKIPVTRIDLLPHESAFKNDRANLVVPTQNYYLFRRTLMGAALYGPMRLLELCRPLLESMLRLAGRGPSTGDLPGAGGLVVAAENKRRSDATSTQGRLKDRAGLRRAS